MTKKAFERLPRSIIPQNYNVTLKTDLLSSLCTGSVEISLEVSDIGSVILLDALELKIGTCSLKLADGVCLEPQQVRLIPDDERLELTFAKPLPLGPCTLSINFEGEISTKLRGFHKTKPKTESEGVCEEHGVTQFAATEARRCFPCWDEPSFKATFELTFIAPSELQTLSNMEIEETTDLGDGWKRVRYPKTPKMSSYLVAFAVGKYDFVESSTKSNIKVRVYTPEGMRACGGFSLNFAVKSLEFYEDYFSIPYPLKKLDLLAVSDFAYGAMENWGLVVFRQTALLFDDLQSDSSRRQTVSTIVAHELAHQWFGNLVTMEWWTHLWLNEGFAKFMEYICTHTLNPELGLRSQFSLELNRALQLDVLDSSHPIEVPINHPSETDEIFDAISYQKGAAIISMLYHHIGDERFRQGMTKYLTKYEYANARTEDLWQALQTPTESSVLELMDAWTSQMGFPQLTVKITERELSISQEKFYSDAGSALKAVAKPTWKVPISIATNKTATPIKIVLEDFSTKIQLPEGSTWAHVNSGGTGVFRVLYEEPMFLNLLAALKNKELVNDKDRYIIHADLAAQVAANYRNSVQLLRLTSVLEDDESFIVWVSITDALNELAAVYQDDLELSGEITSFARKILTQIFASLGWDRSPADDHCRCLLRALVIDALIAFDDKDVIAEASRRLQESLTGRSSLPVDLKFAAYTGFAKSEQESTWDTLWEIFNAAKLQEDELKVLLALASTDKKEIILKILDTNLSDQIRSQYGPRIVSAVAKTTLGQRMLWSHYIQHHIKYNEKFNAGIQLPSFIKALTSGFSTLEMADEIQAFFEKNPIPGTERSLAQTRERILRRAAWRQRDKDCLSTFFKE